jgi:hypothetical protein
MKKQCEGWRRYGGVFTFGPVRWEQCKNDSIVMLTVRQEEENTHKMKTEELPSCQTCWDECKKNDIEIKEQEELKKVEQLMDKMYK